MKNLLLAALASLGLGGCYADDYNPGPAPVGVAAPGPAGGVYADSPPAGVSVPVAPPAPQYETPLDCGYNSVYVPGQYDWNGSWYWTAGYCAPARAGYSWIAPYYSNGVYIRGYWGVPGGGGYYGGRYYGGRYYGGGAYYNRGVAPGYRGGYVAPGYRGGYVGAPAYRGGAPAGGYRGPAAGYRAPAPNYRAPAARAPAARPAPAAARRR